jgi:hypothetical protein
MTALRIFASNYSYEYYLHSQNEHDTSNLNTLSSFINHSITYNFLIFVFYCYGKQNCIISESKSPPCKIYLHI